ncbi:hypothetical protein [Streptomyces sp. NPDC055287]
MDLAVVRAAGWRQGLRDAGRFAPFCRRAMLLTRRPSRLEELLAEADFYGIGVFLAAEHGVVSEGHRAARRPAPSRQAYRPAPATSLWGAPPHWAVRRPTAVAADVAQAASHVSAAAVGAAGAVIVGGAKGVEQLARWRLQRMLETAELEPGEVTRLVKQVAEAITVQMDARAVESERFLF